jgi:hypothetical protein
VLFFFQQFACRATGKRYKCRRQCADKQTTFS